MSEIKPIHSEKDYENALAEVERLWGARSGTPEGDRLDVLATLIDAYESEYHPIDPPDPIEAIKFRMEQQGLTRKDLESVLGTRTRVAEVLNRRRALSINMIRRLYEELKISAEVLIRPSRAASTMAAVLPIPDSNTQLPVETIPATSNAPQGVRARGIGKQPSMEEYWVYQNWTHDRARVHRAACSYCNHGRGVHGSALDRNGEWKGPFTDRAAAFAAMNRVGRTDSRACQRCAP
jgi:HTH-type transcriptional regulator / antitoxin HigA